LALRHKQNRKKKKAKALNCPWQFVLSFFLKLLKLPEFPILTSRTSLSFVGFETAYDHIKAEWHTRRNVETLQMWLVIKIIKTRQVAQL
jgi:hypothetical protein